MAIEEARYSIIEKEKGFGVRQYESHIVAETLWKAILRRQTSENENAFRGMIVIEEVSRLEEIHGRTGKA